MTDCKHISNEISIECYCGCHTRKPNLITPFFHDKKTGEEYCYDCKDNHYPYKETEND
jgi:hypothetical protein